MKRITWLFTVISILILVSSAAADSGCEFGPSQKLVAYPGSVSASDDQTAPYRLRLSKDGRQDVRGYFAEKKKPADFFRENIADGLKSIDLYEVKVACGKKAEVLLLRMSVRVTDDTNVSQAFAALKGMTLMGQHTEAEYKQAMNQYGSLLKAFFRTVNTPEGGTINEGRQILDKYRKLEKQQRSEMAPGTSDDKQKAADMREKMREMKARGDYAGMAALAQQYQGKAQGDRRVQQAKGEMNRDMWDLWLQCLNEMSKAAYYTKLDYSAEIAE